MKQPYKEREKVMPNLFHRRRTMMSYRVLARTLGLGAGLCIRLRKRSEEGGALVEMALVLPILMLILTGIFSFGIAMANYIQLTEAVDVGGRQLAISRGMTGDICATAVAAIENAAPSLNPALMSFTIVLNGDNVGGTSCNTTAAAADMKAAPLATPPGSAQVTVTYPCNLAVYGRNLLPGCHLVAQTTEMIQ
jgi:Flp pilus assembly protein TadG